MSASYPSAIASLPAPASTLAGPTNHTTAHQDLNDEVTAVETTLGVNPHGSYASVAARLKAGFSVCTSSTRPSPYTEGMLIYETDTDLFQIYDGSAWVPFAGAATWTNYTPTFTGSVTNPAVGSDGTRIGRYMQLGKIGFWEVLIIFGTSGGGAAAGSGTYAIGVPPLSPASSTPPWNNFPTIGHGHGVFAGTRYNLEALLASGAIQLYVPAGPVTNTSPGSVTFGDSIRLQGFYEIA